MNIRKFSCVLAAVCASALGLGACGTDDSGSSGDAVVRVLNVGQYDPTAIGVDAAEWLGTFKEAGVSVKSLHGQDVVPGLASGDVDFGLASPNRVIGAIAKGLKAKIVGPTVDSWTQYIIVSKQSGVSSLDDFHGGKIGISQVGSSGDYSTVAIAKAMGWKQSDYEKVPLGDLDALSAALETGQIDAFMWSAEAAFALDAQGSGVIIGNVADVVHDTPLSVLVATDEFIDDHAETARKFCDVYYAAQTTFAEDLETAVKAFVEWGVDPDIAKQMVDGSAKYVSRSSSLSPNAFANMATATNATIEGSDVTGAEVEDMYLNCEDIG